MTDEKDVRFGWAPSLSFEGLGEIIAFTTYQSIPEDKPAVLMTREKYEEIKAQQLDFRLGAVRQYSPFQRVDVSALEKQNRADKILEIVTQILNGLISAKISTEEEDVGLILQKATWFYDAWHERFVKGEGK